MKTHSVKLLLLLMLAALSLPTWAYPPAPPHQIFGMARGVDGTPLMDHAIRVVLETDAGVTVSGTISPNLQPGVNFELIVPMDAGVTPDPYIPNALTPLVPFRIWVIIGTTTNLPIEMTGSFANLGEPGESTRIDLTLGEDTDGDGLPDAWEEIVIAMLGGGLTLGDITPGGDADGDGMSNYDEYIAGTYAFDAEDGFALAVAERRAGSVVCEFLAIRGRTYEIQRTTDLQQTWTPVSFTVPAEDPGLRSTYSASDVRVLEIVIPDATGSQSTSFSFRGIVK